MSIWGGARRRGLLAAVVPLLAVAVVCVVPVSASAFPQGDVGNWRGAPIRTGVAAPVESHPLPLGSGHGRRVVYDQQSMHVWAVDAHGTVVKDWKVSGRRDWPADGTYHVFSKALWSRSSISDVGFQWMVRFAHGHSTNIGFHSIPYDSSGHLIQTTKQLGHPVKGGGCVRSQLKDAEWLYRWASLGTTVVVLG